MDSLRDPTSESKEVAYIQFGNLPEHREKNIGMILADYIKRSLELETKAIQTEVAKQLQTYNKQQQEYFERFAPKPSAAHLLLSFVTPTLQEITKLKVKNDTVIKTERKDKERVTKMLQILEDSLRHVEMDAAALYSLEQIDSQTVTQMQTGINEQLSKLSSLLSQLAVHKTGFCGGSGDLPSMNNIFGQLATKMEHTFPLYCKLLDLKIKRPEQPVFKMVQAFMRDPLIDFVHIEVEINNKLVEMEQKKLKEIRTFAKNAAPPPPTQSAKIEAQEATKQPTPRELFLIGLGYYFGKGMNRSVKKAVELLHLAAKQGCDEAQVMLGQMYLEGTDLPADRRRAFEIFSQLAGERNATAQYCLGKMLDEEFEQGATENGRMQAIDLYTSASNHPNSPNGDAMVALGKIKEKAGHYDEARQLYLRATEEFGHKEAMNHLGMMMLHKRTPGTPEEAFQLIFKSAQMGCTPAMSNLGALLITGNGVERDSLSAQKWLEKAAKNGDAEAFKNLGVLAYQQATFSKNPEDEKFFKANFYFRMALSIQPGHSEANYYLGAMLDSGLGGSQDLVLAAKHYAKALESDSTNSKALYRLGKIYLEGRGVGKPDLTTAIEMLVKSAKLQNTDAMIFLGDLYQSSAVVKPSVEAALVYYTKAKELGNALGEQKLADLSRKHGNASPNGFEADHVKMKLKAMPSGYIDTNY